MFELSVERVTEPRKEKEVRNTESKNRYSSIDQKMRQTFNDDKAPPPNAKA